MDLYPIIEMAIESVLSLMAKVNFPFSSDITPLPEFNEKILQENRGSFVWTSVIFPVIILSWA
jgi:hypothetical protein